MGLSQDIRQQLINSFKTEQAEHVQKINEGLLALEKNPAGQGLARPDLPRGAQPERGRPSRGDDHY